MKTAYINARVYTGEGPLCEAFIVKDGIFTHTGSNKQILSLLSEDDRCMDLEGRFVCPGFNDSHMHLLGSGAALKSAPLKEHTGSLRELTAFLRGFLAENPAGDGQWLLGRGWNQDHFTDVSRMPDRHDLDSVSTGVPIMITRACGHICVLNSRALELCAIGPDSKAPAGGAIGFESGFPNGQLSDNAMELALRCIPSPGKTEIKDMLRAACAQANRYGITSVQTDDYKTFRGVPWQTVFEVYREMAEAGELTVRVSEQAQFTDPKELRGYIASGHLTGTGSPFFRNGPIKLLGDGSLGGRTAHLSVPYADAPETCGFSLFPEETLAEMVFLAHSHGLQLAVHAIGDACLDRVLDTLGKAAAACPRTDHRHGIVHCQITRPDQWAKIRDLGLHVYAQSIFLDYDNHIVEKRVGRALAKTSYHWKTLMDMGVSVSNGSDCPVEKPDVMAGIQCAVTRKSLDGTGPYLPEEAFSVKEALDSFTWRGAEASFEEHIKGRIVPGFLADFTVLDGDPFETAPEEIHSIPVAGCCLGGKWVYLARGFQEAQA